MTPSGKGEEPLKSILMVMCWRTRFREGAGDTPTYGAGVVTRMECCMSNYSGGWRGLFERSQRSFLQVGCCGIGS
jgi:hypothetical protein